MNARTQNLKCVRIDDRTVIQVRRSIPDEVARTNFLEKYKLGSKAPSTFRDYRRRKIRVGTLEDLSQFLSEASETGEE